MGGYSWTINGMDILDVDLAAINLEVKMDTEAVAPSIVNALAGGDPTRQISLTHNGDFGFKASLTLNVGNEYEGQYGNLYYHDSNGKLVFMNAGEIDGDGNVTLDFSHASDYVIVIGRDRTEEEAQNQEVVEPEEPTEPSTEAATDAAEPVAKSGSGMTVILVIIVIAIAVAAVVLLKKKK